MPTERTPPSDGPAGNGFAGSQSFAGPSIVLHMTGRSAVDGRPTLCALFGRNVMSFAPTKVGRPCPVTSRPDRARSVMWAPASGIEKRDPVSAIGFLPPEYWRRHTLRQSNRPRSMW